MFFRRMPEKGGTGNFRFRCKPPDKDDAEVQLWAQSILEEWRCGGGVGSSVALYMAGDISGDRIHRSHAVASCTASMAYADHQV
jgi:hypothetical protein